MIGGARNLRPGSGIIFRLFTARFLEPRGGKNETEITGTHHLYCFHDSHRLTHQREDAGAGQSGSIGSATCGRPGAGRARAAASIGERPAVLCAGDKDTTSPPNYQAGSDIPGRSGSNPDGDRRIGRRRQRPGHWLHSGWLGSLRCTPPVETLAPINRAAASLGWGR